MNTTVIFTTYESPKWLEKTLWGFLAQTVPPHEVIVADDGSGPETANVVERATKQAPFGVKHVWQPHEGFGKCRILNKAITESEGDYIVFTDGDCIPHPQFIEVHSAFAERGRFLSSGYFKLPMTLSEMIAYADVASGSATDPSWLRANGLPWTPKLIKLHAVRSRFGRLLDALTPTRPTWNGHGSSTWKDYIVEANGFDERMRYGGQDREFGERLENAGIRGKQIRHRAVVVHLDHARGYATPESISRNLTLRAETRRSGVKRTPYGIVKTPEAEAELTAFLSSNVPPVGPASEPVHNES